MSKAVLRNWSRFAGITPDARNAGDVSGHCPLTHLCPAANQ